MWSPLPESTLHGGGAWRSPHLHCRVRFTLSGLHSLHNGMFSNAIQVFNRFLRIIDKFECVLLHVECVRIQNLRISPVTIQAHLFNFLCKWKNHHYWRKVCSSESSLINTMITGHVFNFISAASFWYWAWFSLWECPHSPNTSYNVFADTKYFIKTQYCTKFRFVDCNFRLIFNLTKPWKDIRV